MRRRLVLATLVLAAFAGAAAAAEPPELLSAEQAFALSVEARDGARIAARFNIAAGYYLYRDKLRFTLADGDIAAPTALPAGKRKDDPFFGAVEIYRDSVVVELRLDRERGGETVRLVVDSQGCADLGVCYPAQRQTVAIGLPKPGAPPGPPVEASPRKKPWFN